MLRSPLRHALMRGLAVLLLALLLGVLLTAALPGPARAQPTAVPAAGAPALPRLPPLKAGDTVLVGVTDRFPPFHEWQPGATAPKGLDAELLDQVARLTGLRFEYRRYANFSQLMDALQRGEVRLTPAIAQTAERATALRFTRSYASVQQAFMGAAELTSIPSTPDLSGRRVAVAKGHVAESIAIERFPAAGRPVYATVDLAIDAVLRGEADFVLEARPTLEALMASRPAEARLRVLRTYGFPEGHMRLATALRDAELAQQMDAALGALDAAELKALVQRWLLPPPAPAVAPTALAVAPLRVGYLPGDAPFSRRGEDGRAEGIGIRMMEATARRAGLALAGFEPVSLRDGLAALREGRLDLMLGLTDIAERRDRMSFVGPYRANPLVILSRKQYSVWDLHQLAGQRLAMVEGFFGIPYVRAAHPAIEIVTCESFEGCMTLVEQGRASGALYGLQGAYERLGARAGTPLQITGTVPGLYDEHNIGVSKARASLAPLLRDALNVVLAEDMARIEAEWLAEESRERVDWARVRLVAAVAAGVLLLLALAAWAHTRRLRAEIARTEAAQQESEAYLAFMAHEVRNSLQSVSGAVALLRGSSRPDAAQEPLLDALGRSAHGTLGLLNGLLDRHRLHAGRLALELRADSLERVLGAVLDEMRPAAQAKGLRLLIERSTALEGWWRVDALRLQQIVRNLLVNAIKFSHRGTITLRAGLEPGSRGTDWRRVRVEVIDQGPGMDAATAARVFERFNSAGGDRPGTGLGLHLCRDLATALGGELTLASAPGEGSRFTLLFEAEAAGALEQRPAGHLARLLVVEDSPVYSLLLRQAFENRGVVVHVAESLQEARAALIASVAGAGETAPPFDCVLADTQLGDGRVDELLRFVREGVRPGVVMPPVICMSAEFDGPTLKRLVQCGAAELLSKDSDVIAFAARCSAAFAQLREG